MLDHSVPAPVPVAPPEMPPVVPPPEPMRLPPLQPQPTTSPTLRSVAPLDVRARMMGVPRSLGRQRRRTGQHSDRHQGEKRPPADHVASRGDRSILEQMYGRPGRRRERRNVKGSGEEALQGAGA